MGREAEARPRGGCEPAGSAPQIGARVHSRRFDAFKPCIKSPAVCPQQLAQQHGAQPKDLRSRTEREHNLRSRTELEGLSPLVLSAAGSALRAYLIFPRALSVLYACLPLTPAWV